MKADNWVFGMINLGTWWYRYSLSGRIRNTGARRKLGVSRSPEFSFRCRKCEIPIRQANVGVDRTVGH